MMPDILVGDDFDQRDFNRRLTEVENTLGVLEGKVDRVLELLTKMEGAGLVVKTIIWIGGPLVAFLYWAKDHIKF